MIGKIILLVSSLNVGDISQSQVLTNSEGIIIDVSNASAQDDYLAAISKIPLQDPYVNLAIGEKGMEFLKILTQKKLLDEKHSYSILMIHQYSDAFADISIDHIIVPEVTIDTDHKWQIIKKFKHRTLTFAVLSNNPSEAALKSAYDTWDIANKPDLNSKYIIVMMPGDAPDAAGNIRYFTEESASKLLNDIHKLWQKLGKQHTLLIMNGLRTGKHDPKTGKISCTHEYLKGSDASTALDHISRYFIKQLKTSEMKYHFYNFAFEVDGSIKKTITAFPQLLYLAEQNDNYFILPGGSVSLMGQIPLYLPAYKIIVFQPSSMNEAHKAIMHKAFRRSYLSYFSEDGEVIVPKDPTMKRTEGDNAVIVRDLAHGYREKFK